MPADPTGVVSSLKHEYTFGCHNWFLPLTRSTDVYDIMIFLEKKGFSTCNCPTKVSHNGLLGTSNAQPFRSIYIHVGCTLLVSVFNKKENYKIYIVQHHKYHNNLWSRKQQKSVPCAALEFLWRLVLLFCFLKNSYILLWLKHVHFLTEQYLAWKQQLPDFSASLQMLPGPWGDGQFPPEINKYR